MATYGPEMAARGFVFLDFDYLGILPFVEEIYGLGVSRWFHHRIGCCNRSQNYDNCYRFRNDGCRWIPVFGQRSNVISKDLKTLNPKVNKAYFKLLNILYPLMRLTYSRKKHEASTLESIPQI
ncbi:hypothetical protein [Flammeovirga sp. EKP202]|uniref:hypothetical protein n=1 Tax=Flammeovirga sp. EKP202 TaxID=2770592 RepID=UPI00165FC539|nr:hypothetical protein [Flammeovirga sp. EKP202]MBD0404517.1 hypothetical protein [Flammeovirga sp. EKP202]